MDSIDPLVLLFAILAIVKLIQSAEAAVLDVFLPVLLLVPSVYALHIPHLPPLYAIDCVLLPIGIWALVSGARHWKFQRADLWIALFVLASIYTDYINNGLLSALDSMPTVVCEALLAYCIGKLLIEQRGIREPFARRMVHLLAVVALLCVAEFIGRKNLFVTVMHRFFFSDGYWWGQMRGRFMRVVGPFAGAEEAGIVFMMGFFLALWLWFANKSRQDESKPRYFGAGSSILSCACILLGLYMTLSRGPMLGCAAGFLIARIGLVRNRRLALIVALVLAATGGILANYKAMQLSQMDLETATEEQLTAHYRTQLFTVYGPVAEAGGLFGWSAATYPRAINLASIDNEYLFLWVANGLVGLSLFILIATEGAVAVVQAVRRSRQRIDTCFYYCLGGILAGLMVVIITVFLAAQGFVLFFLFIGWSQSLHDQYGTAAELPQRPALRFAFRRVFS
jgi:hypothetical protein